MKAGARSAFVQRLSASAGLSALFVIVYGGCNWVSAHRTGVGTVNFAWEREIPFVPLMIAPYMSIDLFFVSAPFLCTTRTELATLAKRIATAILTAGVCFLLFPFRFAFPRPHASGWLGEMFDVFRSVDPPYNLVPCLHITLCLLLAQIFVRHTRGILRVAVILWFALIAASPLLTWQHHIADVVSGFLLAALCWLIFPDARRAIFSSSTPITPQNIEQPTP